MRRTSKRAAIFWLLYFAAILILVGGLVSTIAGCNEDQLVMADRIVTDANAWADQGRLVLHSPAGQTLPPDVRLYGTLATALVMGGAAAYEKWRLSQMSRTTKAIVKGIESAEKEITVNPTNPVKAAIALEMRKAGVFDVGNKIVDRLKIG